MVSYLPILGYRSPFHLVNHAQRGLRSMPLTFITTWAQFGRSCPLTRTWIRFVLERASHQVSSIDGRMVHREKLCQFQHLFILKKCLVGLQIRCVRASVCLCVFLCKHVICETTLIDLLIKFIFSSDKRRKEVSRWRWRDRSIEGVSNAPICCSLWSNISTIVSCIWNHIL